MPAASHVFAYDANGNIRRSLGSYRALDAQGGVAAASTTQDYWYRYNAMNRMTTAKGQLVSGVISRGTAGVDIVYRADGNRAWTINAQNRREDYTYDNAGRVTRCATGPISPRRGQCWGLSVMTGLAGSSRKST